MEVYLLGFLCSNVFEFTVGLHLDRLPVLLFKILGFMLPISPRIPPGDEAP